MRSRGQSWPRGTGTWPWPAAAARSACRACRQVLELEAQLRQLSEPRTHHCKEGLSEMLHTAAFLQRSRPVLQAHSVLRTFVTSGATGPRCNCTATVLVTQRFGSRNLKREDRPQAAQGRLAPRQPF